MFQRIPVMIGQYRPIQSFMHSLDARVKIIPVLLLLMFILLTGSIFFYLLMLFFLVGLLVYAGVNSQIVKDTIKPLLYLVAFTSIYHLLFSGKGTEIIFSISFITLYKGAVTSAVFYSMKLILFLISAFLITLTCSPSELSESITKLLKPIKIIKFPLSDFSLILFISLRFIPIFYEEFLTIRNAQKIRGIHFNGTFVSKILHLKALLIPLFLSAIRRADTLSDSLLVRGYNSNSERTYFNTNKLTFVDIGFLLSSLIIIGTSFFFIGLK